MTNKISKTLKEKIYKNLSYTAQDYETILLEFVDLFTESDIGLTWNNMSEADPIFILLHLLAAHKDILNYMLDYRVLETYMTTARERASLIRNANSIGYKIPGKLPSTAQYTVTKIEGNNYTLNPYTQFVADDGTSWVYTGETITVSSTPQTITLVQGVPVNETFTAATIINNENASKILLGNSIPTQQNNNYRLSTLKLENDTNWEEAPTLVGRSIHDSPKPYIIDKDTTGLYYIKFPEDIKIQNITGTFNLQYLNTNDAAVTTAPLALSLHNIYLDIQQNTFTQGKGEATEAEIREGYLNYRGNLNSLSTLEDYKQWMLTKQTAIPNVSKVMVIDTMDSTNPNIAAGGENDLGNIGIYFTVDNGTGHQVVADTTNLELLIKKAKQGGVLVHFNNDGNTPGNPAAPVTINVKFTTSGDSEVDNKISQLIETFVYNKDFGDSIKDSEIIDLIITSEYRSYYIGKTITAKINNKENEDLSYYQYAKIGTTTL